MKIWTVIPLCILFAVFAHKEKTISDPILTNIRVINHSKNHFSNVMLYSMKFDNLKPNDTSVYKVLDFDILSDDPLIYCSIGDTNYARYLKIPVDGEKNISYVIDSIQDGILYVTFHNEELTPTN